MTLDDEMNARLRLCAMFKDTVKTFEALDGVLKDYFEEESGQLSKALNECLDDFVRETARSNQPDPCGKISEMPVGKLINCGFYGHQLSLKESQVSRVNFNLRSAIEAGANRWQEFRAAFKKWVNVINNFLGSLIAAGCIAEALREMKDALRDALPEEKQQKPIRSNVPRTMDE